MSIHASWDKGRVFSGWNHDGHRNSEIFKQVDIVATALYYGMAVKALCDLDLSYTLTLSYPWAPVQMAAMK